MNLNFFSISALLLSITSFALVVILLMYGKTKLHRICALFNLFVFIWGIGTLLISLASTPSQALLSWKIAVTGGLFIAVLFYHTVYMFCELDKKQVLVGVYSQGIVFWLVSCFLRQENIYGDLQFVFNSFLYPKATFIWTLMAISWTCVSASGHLELLKFVRKSKGVRHAQGIYLLLGVALGFIGGGSVLLPSWGIPIYPVGNFGVALYAIVITYAILRYRLMDIKIVLTRAGIFVIVYLLVLGIPLGLSGWGKSWLLGLVGPGWYWVPIVLALILATGGPFIYLALTRRAEARMQAEEHRARELLKQASDGMLRIRSLKRLVSLMVHISCKTLKLENAAVFLLDENSGRYNLVTSRLKSRYNYPEFLDRSDPLVKRLASIQSPLVYEEVKMKSQEPKEKLDDSMQEIISQMQSLSGAVIIPAVCWGRLLGFLILSEKKSKRVFSREDLNVLHVLSNQAALAVENAFFWQREEQRVVEASQEEAVSSVTFGAGHQFNNRLYAISMAADSFLTVIKGKNIEQAGAEELKGLLNVVTVKLNKIVEECQFGGQITAGIMSLTGRTPSNFKEFNLSEIIASSLEFVDMKHSQDKIEGNRPIVDISCQIAENLPKVFGSDAQIRDCIFNLVDNSYDAIYKKDELIQAKDSELIAASPELANYINGQPYLPQVQIKAFTKDSAMFITVTDNGIGVKDEHRKRLFAGYFTTKATGVKGYGKGGHGIGLFTIRKLILAHKGKLSYISEYGKSTTFTIELPLGQKEKESKDNA